MRYRITRADGSAETQAAQSVLAAADHAEQDNGTYPRIVRVEEYEPKMVTRWRCEWEGGNPTTLASPPWDHESHGFLSRYLLRCERVDVEDES